MTLTSTTRAISLAAVCLCTMIAANAALAAGERSSDRWEATIVPGPDAQLLPVSDEGSEADALYADAQAYLNLREWSAAERILDILVRQYPQTSAGRRGAGDLARIRAEVMSASRRFSLGASELIPPPSAPLGQPAPVAPQSLPGSTKAPSTVGDLLAWLGLPGDPMQERFRAEVGDRIFFAAHSAQLGQRGQDALQAQARWLIDNPEAQVIIEAHADEPGEGIDNGVVSMQRADAVKAYFVGAGVPAARLQVVSYGREHRVALCDSAACKAQNRRVVMKVSKLDPLPGRHAQRPQDAPARR